ncbi:Detected protein of unknown function [Hibiscus syriacus]|uniref:Uncharacterized protein n=1 Tax=Hibiscus syriacus TaxID=106335 RepID=A0A6A2ZNR4_HIBSY|nr:putative disease resistance protein At4g19050 isoform X2 [Hibiscus syriacus]KAE8693186.1 Detected protein of unknown function [Hibiscus syriacus]
MSNTQAAIGEESSEGVAQIEIGNRGSTKEFNEEVDAQVEKFMGTADGGMMRTLCGDAKEKMISLSIDRSCLCREVHDTFFGDKQNLNLLAIVPPRLESPEELPMSKADKLLVLMLRGSYLLENVNIVGKLRALTVLEISGSRDWKIYLPADFFLQVPRLRSLDFSGIGIESLPDSFSELTDLRRLALRQCSSLEQLPKLAKFTKLEVIDLFECTSLKKIQEKSFMSLEKLKVINFSHTKIQKLPIIRTLRNLSIVLSKGCTALTGMRLLRQVSSIKVLDLSGATNIREIMYDCFEGPESLRELDLSETRIQYLPPVAGNLQKLRLKKCELLRYLPDLWGHTRLEEIDLSGCKMLENLPDFSALQKLRILDLRDTKLYSKDLVESLNHIKGLKILS